MTNIKNDVEEYINMAGNNLVLGEYYIYNENMIIKNPFGGMIIIALP